MSYRRGTIFEEFLNKFKYFFIASTSSSSASSSLASLSAAGAGGLSGIVQQTLDPKLNVLPTDNFTEKDVTDLLKLGFNREQVISELRYFRGDKTQSTAALFAKSLKF